MNVVTISRQIGSLGFSIGKALADHLGYKLVWRELINQAAIRAGAPEVALAMIDELHLLGISPSQDQCQEYNRAVELVLCELAHQGNVVIVGRGGQLVLKDHPEAVHVRIIAPLEVRVMRVVASRKVTTDAALAQIQATDRARRQYFQRFYQRNWDDPELYDLTINTGRIDAAIAVQIICQLLARPSLEAGHDYPTEEAVD